MGTLSRRGALGGLAGMAAALQTKALAQAPTDVVPGSITYEDIPYPYPVKSLPLTLYGQDVRMAYMDVPPVGRREGRTVVLLHGMNFGGFYFGGPIEALRKEGFRVIVPDQIGFGRSSKPIIPYNFHDMAMNTRKLLEIAGHREGGRSSGTRWAACWRRGSRLLIRISSSVRCSTIRSGSTDVRWERRGRGAKRLTKPPWRRRTISLSGDSRPTFSATFPERGSRSTRQYVRILYAPTLSADWPRLAMVRAIYRQITYLDPVVYDWAHIKARTLVIGGDKDGENFPALAKHIADTIPHGELVLIPNVGHVPHIQVPDVFKRELLKFLA